MKINELIADAKENAIDAPDEILEYDVSALCRSCINKPNERCLKRKNTCYSYERDYATAFSYDTL